MKCVQKAFRIRTNNFYFFLFTDSPVWLRQQQQRTESTDSISPLHFNKKSNTQLWKIVEQDYSSDNHHKEETSVTSTCPEIRLKNNTCSFEKSVPGDVYSDMLTKREYTFNYDHLDYDAPPFKKYQDNSDSSSPQNNNQTTELNSFKDPMSKSMNDLNISVVGERANIPPKTNPPKNQFSPLYCPYINLISPKFTNKMTYMLSKNHNPLNNILPAVALSKSYSHSDSNVSQSKNEEPSPVSTIDDASPQHDDVLTDAKQCDCSTSNPDISV